MSGAVPVTSTFPRSFAPILLAACIVCMPVAVVPHANAALVTVAAQPPAPAGPIDNEGNPPTSGERRPTQVDTGAQENDDAQYRHSASVKAVAGALHIPVETAAVIFEVINFLVLALGIAWFLLRALPAAFRKRSDDILNNLTSARTATEDANARLREVEERLSRMDADIASLRAQSEADMQREHARLLQHAEDEKADIVQSTRQEIASATARAQRELKQYAATLAVDRAARELRLTQDDDRAIVENFGASLASKNGSRN